MKHSWKKQAVIAFALCIALAGCNQKKTKEAAPTEEESISSTEAIAEDSSSVKTAETEENISSEASDINETSESKAEVALEQMTFPAGKLPTDGVFNEKENGDLLAPAAITMEENSVRLPATIAELSALGFTSTEKGDTVISSGKYIPDVSFTLGDITVIGRGYNGANEDKTIDQTGITKITTTSKGVKFNGIQIGDSYEDVFALFGKDKKSRADSAKEEFTSKGIIHPLSYSAQVGASLTKDGSMHLISVEYVISFDESPDAAYPFGTVKEMILSI